MKTFLAGTLFGVVLSLGLSIEAQQVRRPAWHPLPDGIKSASCFLHFQNGDFQSVDYRAGKNPEWGKTSTKQELEDRRIVDTEVWKRQETFYKTAQAYALHGKSVEALARSVIALHEVVQLQEPLMRGLYVLGVHDEKADRYRPLTEDDIMMFRAGMKR